MEGMLKGCGKWQDLQHDPWVPAGNELCFWGKAPAGSCKHPDGGGVQAALLLPLPSSTRRR